MTMVFTLGRALSDHAVSIEEIAAGTGLDESKLKAVEQNGCKAVRLSSLEALCDAIGCDVGELFAKEESKR